MSGNDGKVSTIIGRKNESSNKYGTVTTATGKKNSAKCNNNHHQSSPSASAFWMPLIATGSCPSVLIIRHVDL